MDVSKKEDRRDASENGINRPKEHEICKVVAGLKQKAVLAQAILSSPDLCCLMNQRMVWIRMRRMRQKGGFGRSSKRLYGCGGQS